jgi:hypothetical protein
MTSAITATGLRKSFGGTAVLDGIDVEAGAGTTFSLGALAAPHAFLAPRPRACGNGSPSHGEETAMPNSATGLRRLASAIERAGGEDTGSEGASR